MPLLGRIAAGRPVEAVESAESISVNDIIGNREVYVLEVNGDSMSDEHIVSGDFVMVERTRTAREGEIIVALVDGSETTLKRFYREGTMIRLAALKRRHAADLRAGSQRRDPGQGARPAPEVRLAPTQDP